MTTSTDSTDTEALAETGDRLLMAAAHREVDALVELGVIGAHRGEQLKGFLTADAVEQHDQCGMSIRDMVDMYRDVITPT